MKILATDTSTDILALALCEAKSGANTNDMTVLGEFTLRCFRAHTEKMLAVLDSMLGELQCPLKSVDLLAVSIGPGSFTGLRVGMAAWKGMATALSLPIVGVPTLDAMTRLGSFRDGCVCPVLDARMHEVFGAVYRFQNGERSKLTRDLVCPIDRLLEEIPENTSPVFFLGNGTTLYKTEIHQRFPDAVLLPDELAIPRAVAIAREALYLLQTGASTDGTALAPIYLRKSQAEQLRERKTL